MNFMRLELSSLWTMFRLTNCSRHSNFCLSGKGVEVMDEKKKSGEPSGSKQQIYGLDFDNWTSRKGKQRKVSVT